MNRINLVQTLGAIGDIDWLIQVIQKDPNDFTKAQCDNGQIIAAQLQSGRAKQHAKQACQGRRHRHNDPQRHVEPTRKQGGNGRKCFKQMG